MKLILHGVGIATCTNPQDGAICVRNIYLLHGHHMPCCTRSCVDQGQGGRRARNSHSNSQGPQPGALAQQPLRLQVQQLCQGTRTSIDKPNSRCCTCITCIAQALAAISKQIRADQYLRPHLRYYLREIRAVVYSQFLESYKSVTMASMASAFGLSVEFLDSELAEFIAAGRLSARIDKVAGVVETDRCGWVVAAHAGRAWMITYTGPTRRTTCTSRASSRATCFSIASKSCPRSSMWSSSLSEENVDGK